MSEKFTIAPATGVHVVRAGGAIIGETCRRSMPAVAMSITVRVEGL